MPRGGRSAAVASFLALVLTGVASSDPVPSTCLVMDPSPPEDGEHRHPLEVVLNGTANLLCYPVLEAQCYNDLPMVCRESRACTGSSSSTERRRRR